MKIIVVVTVFAALLLFEFVLRRFVLNRKRSLDNQFVSLSELRRELAATRTGCADAYDRELKPYLDGLEIKYGDQLPASEVIRLQQVVKSKLTDIEKRRGEIINTGARQGAVISTAALRARMEASKANYEGADPVAYGRAVDDLMDSLSTTYGDAIPVDEAHRLMKQFDSETAEK
jgi:hypothetical protein